MSIILENLRVFPVSISFIITGRLNFSLEAWLKNNVFFYPLRGYEIKLANSGLFKPAGLASFIRVSVILKKFK